MRKIYSSNRREFHSLLLPPLRITFCIGIGLLLISCSTLPKETYLTRTCLTGINKVAIVTSISAPEVSYATSFGPATAFLIPLFPLAGLIAVGFESAIKTGVDHGHADNVSEHMDAYSLESKLAHSFIQIVKNGGCFQTIEYAKDKNQDFSKLTTPGYDAVIRLSVHKILLQRSVAEYVSFSARIRGQLENLRSREIVWDREEIVTNPDHQTLDYYKENGLKELDAMLEKAGRNLAYDFAYLK